MGQTDAPGRVLGLDLGDARIGVAISDDERRLAVPIGTVHIGRRRGAQGDRGAGRGARRTLVVVGLPLSWMDRTARAASRPRPSPTRLRAFLPVPVELQDERFSTVEAERGLRERGSDSARAASVVDPTAASDRCKPGSTRRADRRLHGLSRRRPVSSSPDGHPDADRADITRAAQQVAGDDASASSLFSWSSSSSSAGSPRRWRSIEAASSRRSRPAIRSRSRSPRGRPDRTSWPRSMSAG